MSVAIIVAAAENDVIGRASKLPWHLSTDLAYFRRMTKGHPIIMGRTTYEAIGKPLPDRQNIVVTHDTDYEAEGCTVAHSIEASIEAAESDDIFIIGGGKIYEQSLPFVDTIYLTRVHAAPEGDAFFRYNPAEWVEVEHEAHKADDDNEYDFTFITLKRADASS